MNAVVAEKIVQCRLKESLVSQIAEGAPHQRGSTVPDIRSDDFARQLGPFEMSQHGIDRVNQIKPRIDERPVQIKYEQPNGPNIERTQEANHGQFRITE